MTVAAGRSHSFQWIYSVIKRQDSTPSLFDSVFTKHLKCAQTYSQLVWSFWWSIILWVYRSWQHGVWKQICFQIWDVRKSQRTWLAAVFVFLSILLLQAFQILWNVLRLMFLYFSFFIQIGSNVFGMLISTRNNSQLQSEKGLLEKILQIKKYVTSTHLHVFKAFTMTPKTELRCLLFPLIICQMFL